MLCIVLTQLYNCRHCAETHCNCYRTDIRQSVAQIQAQLYSGGKLARFSERHARSRGIPPSLLAIFADDARKEVTRDQVLQGVALSETL